MEGGMALGIGGWSDAGGGDPGDDDGGRRLQAPGSAQLAAILFDRVTQGPAALALAATPLKPHGWSNRLVQRRPPGLRGKDHR
jgi:hypothetical protein